MNQRGGSHASRTWWKEAWAKPTEEHGRNEPGETNQAKRTPGETNPCQAYPAYPAYLAYAAYAANQTCPAYLTCLARSRVRRVSCL